MLTSPSSNPTSPAALADNAARGDASEPDTVLPTTSRTARPHSATSRVDRLVSELPPPALRLVVDATLMKVRSCDGWDDDTGRQNETSELLHRRVDEVVARYNNEASLRVDDNTKAAWHDYVSAAVQVRAPHMPIGPHDSTARIGPTLARWGSRSAPSPAPPSPCTTLSLLTAPLLRRGHAGGHLAVLPARRALGDARVRLLR